MKRHVKYLVTLVLILTVSISALANFQTQVDTFEVNDVYYAVGTDIATGETIISPTITVSWENPSSWADGVDYHEPDFYEITVDNITFGEEDIITILDTDAAYTSSTFDIHDDVNLETGSIYKMYIEPYHYHEDEDPEAEGEIVRELAPNVGDVEIAYAITDLDVEFITNEDSIQVIWDDLGESDFEYRIVYALGDYTGATKATMEDNKEGEIIDLTKDSDDVIAFFDSDSNRSKLSYTIDQNIYPGQIYSIMVEPTTQFYQGRTIVRNVIYPYIRSVSTDIVLSLVEEGDYLRLSWDIPSSFQVGQSQGEYSLVEGTIVESQDGSSRNLVIFDGEAASIGYYRVAKPIWETEYQIQLVYDAVDDTSKESIEPVSNLVTYLPSEYYIQPTIPYIPKLLSETMLQAYEDNNLSSQVYEILEEDHLLPGYSYSGDVDDLLDEEVTFHIDEANNYINLVWGAFQRIDVDETSGTYGDYIYDNNVYYDLWITDQLETLAYAEPVAQDLRYSSIASDNVILNEDEEIIGYKEQLGTYYNTDEKEIIDITPGDLYYIKIVAKKINANETLTSEPNIKTVYYAYNGDSFEPPTISKPPLQEKDEVTDTTGVTILWRETWTELMSADTTESGVLSDWVLEVWVDEEATIYGEARTDTEYFPLYEGDDAIEDFEDYMLSLGRSLDLITREVDLGSDAFGVSDVAYDFESIPYQTVLEAIEEGQEDDADYDFIDYYADLIANDKDGTAPINWDSISPEFDVDDGDYLAYRQDGLVANTSYMFIIYPYRVLDNGDVLYAHYPSYIIVTTSPEEVVISPDPTVPSLYTTEVSPTSIDLTWKYNADFSYEIMYGTVDDVASAESFEFEFPTDTTDEAYPVDGAYYELEVDELFPLTTYYFWIKAIQTSDGTESSWSNPAVGTTSDIEVPSPPRGLGLASAVSREPFGYNLSLAEDYMILEWVLDPEDPYDDLTEATGDVSRAYSYVLEISENSKFVDPLYIVSSGGVNDSVPATITLLDKNIVLAESLIGNRYYYVRAKTILTVTGAEEGQEIVKESVGYTDPIRIITLSFGDEYDGTIDPALTILPDEDFELIYNEVSKSLEFRFRSAEEDAEGASDNQVDQRLISDLIDNKTHEYLIDLTSFEDQEIDFRRVTIPYTVMEAFDSFDVAIKILADNMHIDLEPEAVMSHVYDQVEDYGVAPTLIIDLEDLVDGSFLASMPIASVNEVAVPQDFNIKVISSRRTDPIYYADTPMTLGLKTNSRYEIYEEDMALYVKDNRANWTTIRGDYDKYDALLNFETAVIGSYGLYTYDRTTEIVGNTNTNHWSEVYREAVFESVTVEGLSNYNPEATVSEQAVVQATYGTVMGQEIIDLTHTLTSLESQTLQRAGVKKDNYQRETTISREEAISMFARTAEILSGETTFITASMLEEAEATGVSQAYVVNVAKAKALGLLSDYEGLRAGEALKYGEYFTLWSRVVD